MLAVFTVTSLNDAALRQAVANANSQPGADVIQFQASLSGAINLSVIGDTAVGPSALLVSSQITIQGNAAGITIRRAPGGLDMRLFRVTDTGSLTLESISLTGGIVRGPSDGEGRGGAIYNEGTLKVVASTLFDNQAVGGNAVSGTYGMSGLGGAIFNDDGAVTLENATLSGNVAQSGTGSFVHSSLGGGVYSRNGSVSIYNSTITNSTASTGRGVYVVNESGTVTT